ncbi:MAG: hypothetical protein K9H65_06295 [Bacteroidales bacterium]|nr:hypothetical protein [Bacteroidales bacterium]
MRKEIIPLTHHPVFVKQLKEGLRRGYPHDVFDSLLIFNIKGFGKSSRSKRKE